MQKTLVVRCPNCGSFAQRHLLNHDLRSKPNRESCPQVVRTECPHCDYLLTVCQEDGLIHAVYSPVTDVLRASRTDRHRLTD